MSQIKSLIESIQDLEGNTPRSSGLLTEGHGEVAAPLSSLSEEIGYKAMEGLEENLGSTLMLCIREAIDDEKLVLDPYAFKADILFALHNFIEANPEEVRAAFKPVLDELRVQLPKREKAKQKRNRRY